MRINYKKLVILITGLLFILLSVQTVLAQEDGYTVNLRRDFGYGAGTDVRGTMTISLKGDEAQVGKVVFLIDGKEMVTVNQAPFKFQFDTDKQGAGVHDLSASVLLKDGNTMTTTAIRYKFVTQEEQNSGMKNILLPVGVIIIASFGISILVQTLGRSKKPLASNSPRDYGPLGGTICPKCGHPFARSILGINLIVGKLQRCDGCGKFVLSQRATPAALAAAEALENEIHSDKVEPVRAEEKTNNQVEESKYIDEL